MSTITFEELRSHFDMEGMFLRIEYNMRKGHIPARQMKRWAQDTAQGMVLPDAERTGEYRAAIAEHCARWIDYLGRNPQTAPDDDYLPNAKVEQLRLKM